MSIMRSSYECTFASELVSLRQLIFSSFEIRRVRASAVSPNAAATHLGTGIMTGVGSNSKRVADASNSATLVLFPPR